ncbi:MAG: aminotransferase class V-fold PLP-dependent enzyme [Acidobacteria bacterium]|nr:aminotransferase class V-fold PLP-dependent enzyme [Acidobacteriota bacterium]
MNGGEGRGARRAPLAMSADEFRAAAHRLVDLLADELARIPGRPVTHDERPSSVREALDLDRALPRQGTDAAELLARVTPALFEHSLFNAHPRFFGYITAPPAPIGILGDFLASALNPNVGSWRLSPAASEVEAQTVRWIAELIGASPASGGLLVSGGNMANFVGFFAARAARAPWDVRAQGTGRRPLRVYASRETHTWIQKAADLSGLGTDAIRWVPTGADLRMDLAALTAVLARDRAAGDIPFLVVGTAGSVSTGAIDPLRELAQLCHDEQLWFHVDGAYGGFAAAAVDAPPDLRALASADSVAVDPHKWLYAPLEAGCALVRDPDDLRRAFSYHPPYYHFDEHVTNYVDYGPQNSRGFRALKVWLALQHAGADGYRRMISDDISLSRTLADAVAADESLELVTQSLSITTFRFIPPDLGARRGERAVAEYLNQLNEALLDDLQRSGRAFVSNAVIGDRYVLRACIVNFHTGHDDVLALPGIVTAAGASIDGALRPAALRREQAT